MSSHDTGIVSSCLHNVLWRRFGQFLVSLLPEASVSEKTLVLPQSYSAEDSGPWRWSEQQEAEL